MNPQPKPKEPTFTCVVCKKELTAHEVLNHASLTICEGTHPDVFATLRKEGRLK